MSREDHQGDRFAGAKDQFTKCLTEIPVKSSSARGKPREPMHNPGLEMGPKIINL